jgi:hypothetical protein
MAKSKISERALLQRLNRYLIREEDQTIKKCREDSRWYNDLGDYYTVDIKTKAIVATHVNLEEMARELKVISKHEALEG